MLAQVHTIGSLKDTTYDTLLLDTIDTVQKTMWNITIQVESNNVCASNSTV